MARQFLAALALAHCASSTLLEPFVDVLVKVDVQVSSSGVFAGVLNAAGRSDDGYDACQAADAVLNDCVDSGAFAPTAQIGDANKCACCLGSTPISAVYSMCATYIANDVPSASSAFSTVSSIYNICRAQRPCTAGGGGGGGGVVTVTVISTSTRTFASQTPSPLAPTNLPSACQTMLSIYGSCSRKIAVSTSRVPAREAASCFCYDKSGAWNTAFEDYASSCAPFFRTNYPEDYVVVTELAGLCDSYPPNTKTNPLVFTTAGTRSAGGFVVLSSSSSPSTSSGTNPTGPATSTATTSTSAGLAAPGAPVPGFLLWAANLVTFFLSFFILV